MGQHVRRDPLYSLMCLVDQHRTQRKRRQPKRARERPAWQCLHQRSLRHAFFDFPSLLLRHCDSGDFPCRAWYPKRNQATVRKDGVQHDEKYRLDNEEDVLFNRDEEDLAENGALRISPTGLRDDPL